MKRNARIYSQLFMLVMLGTSLNLSQVLAQGELSSTQEIKLSGIVTCIHPVNGTLSSVLVYNNNRDFGTVTDENGAFSILMGRSDTILFSTAEHEVYLYSIQEDEVFRNHSISVVMETDAIWLNTVTIIGNKSLEQFKTEIMNLDLPSTDNELPLPIVSKYAKQLSTGNGETDLIGPLTYLQNKFDRYYKLRKKIYQK